MPANDRIRQSLTALIIIIRNCKVCYQQNGVLGIDDHFYWPQLVNQNEYFYNLLVLVAV